MIQKSARREENTMPIQIEQIPGENIITGTVDEPFNPENDVSTMFAQFIGIRKTINGPLALIIDFSNTINAADAFSRIVFTLAEAARGIRASKQAQLAGPPILIFVGSGSLADLVTQAIEQEQYGGTKAHLCATQEEALALAREKLADGKQLM
jgi:hypothetical protein